MRRTFLLASDGAGAGGAPRHLRILIVDDDPPIRRLVASLLSRSLRDYRVETTEAKTGEEGLDLLRRERFDLVITDYRMGIVNGVDVLETAARDHRDAARVLITGYADVPVAVDGVNRGQMEIFIPKPWDNTRFVNLIETVLARRSAPPPPPPAAGAPGGDGA